LICQRICCGIKIAAGGSARNPLQAVYDQSGIATQQPVPVEIDHRTALCNPTGPARLRTFKLDIKEIL